MKKIILTIALITYSSTAITAMQQRMTKVYNNLFTQEEGRVAPALPDDRLPEAILVSSNGHLLQPGLVENTRIFTAEPAMPEVIHVVATPATPRNQPHSLVLVLNQHEEEVEPAAENMGDFSLAAPRFAGPLEAQERDRWSPIIDLLNTQEITQPDEDRRQCCSIS